MAYTEFTLELAETELGLTTSMGTVFADLKPVESPIWLTDQLARGMRLALLSEKARSEFIVAPLLLAVRELVGSDLSILSGQRLDVDPERRLLGECDFLLARSEPVPRLRAPLMAVDEAKKNDIEAGLGRCIAQMVGVQIFNVRAEQPVEAIFGCVTTGEDWQFLRLIGSRVLLHQPRLYISNVGLILAAFLRAVGASARTTA